MPRALRKLIWSDRANCFGAGAAVRLVGHIGKRNQKPAQNRTIGADSVTECGHPCFTFLLWKNNECRAEELPLPR